MKKLIIVTMVLAAMQSGTLAMAAQGNKDISADEYSLNMDGFICDWLVCGPFPNPGKWPDLANWDTDFLKTDGGEAKIRPTSEMSYRSKLPALSGKELTVTWRPVRVLPDYRDGFPAIDIGALFSKTTGKQLDNIIGYAFCYIESPADTDAKLKVGSDDGFKAWINGQLVGFERVARGAAIDQNVMPIKLKKGLNTLLLKIEENIGAYSFMARVTDMKDQPLTTVKVRLPVSAKQDEMLFVLHGHGVHESDNPFEPTKNMTKKYINPNAVRPNLPDYSGASYEAMVPDTLDLADMAGLLINAMTEPTDPDKDYENYFWVIFGSNPPYMTHQFSDQIQYHIMANLPLMRMISGNTQGIEKERAFLAWTLKNIDKDGLFYNDPESKPWISSMDQSFAFSDAAPAGGCFASIMQSVNVLHMLTSYGQYTKDQRWLEVARRCVDSLIRLAVDKGDIAYYHKWNYLPGEAYSEGPMPSNFHTRWHDFFVPLAMMQYYDVTGYQPAGDMAQKLLKCQSRTWLFPGDEGLPDKNMCYTGYPVVASVMPMEGALRLDNPGMLKVAQQNFEKYVPYIDKFTGYMPEAIHADTSVQHGCESCYLAWPIMNAAVLSASGAGDNWDNVDRWVRNQFAEAQLKHTDWVGRMNANKPAKPIPPHSTSEDVLARNVGSFSGHMWVNDWFTNRHGGMAIQHCCTARAAAALYNVWDNIIQHEDGKLRVNLLLNRASAVADIDSHIPYTGQVDIKVKQPVELSIR
ncbi:MAG: hypothetical protein DRP56_09520, partial [Planctomycetota bacterium]